MLIFKIIVLTIVGGNEVETCVNFTRAGAVFILALFTPLIPSPSLSGKLQYYLSPYFSEQNGACVSRSLHLIDPWGATLYLPTFSEI